MPPDSTAAPDAKIEAQVFWIRFHKEIVAVIVLAILAVIGFAGYRFYSERQSAAAAALLANAKKAQDFQEVITNYPSTPSGASAYLLLAATQRAEGNYAVSNTTLQEFIAKHAEHELVTTGRVAMAANLESMGRIDDALLMYQTAAASDSKSYAAPLALMSEVRLLKAKQQTQDARRICEKVMSEYPDSFWAVQARGELLELNPPSAPAPGSNVAPGTAPPALIARPPAVAVPSAAPTAESKKK